MTWLEWLQIRRLINPELTGRWVFLCRSPPCNTKSIWLVNGSLVVHVNLSQYDLCSLLHKSLTNWAFILLMIYLTGLWPGPASRPSRSTARSRPWTFTSLRSTERDTLGSAFVCDQTCDKLLPNWPTLAWRHVDSWSSASERLMKWIDSCCRGCCCCCCCVNYQRISAHITHHFIHRLSADVAPQTDALATEINKSVSLSGARDLHMLKIYYKST